MVNHTRIKIPKKYQPLIYEISYFGDSYELNLMECCDIDGGCHLYSYETQKELLSDLPSIWLIPSEKEYKRIYGSELLDDYREDYKSINGKYPPKE